MCTASRNAMHDQFNWTVVDSIISIMLLSHFLVYNKHICIVQLSHRRPNIDQHQTNKMAKLCLMFLVIFAIVQVRIVYIFFSIKHKSNYQEYDRNIFRSPCALRVRSAIWTRWRWTSRSKRWWQLSKKPSTNHSRRIRWENWWLKWNRLVAKSRVCLSNLSWTSKSLSNPCSDDECMDGEIE